MHGKCYIPTVVDTTYIDPSFRHANSRLDIVCVCPELETYVQSCVHKLTPCPDHKAVIMTLMLSERKRGKGYWKLNVIVLKEDGYRKNISDLIKHTMAEYADQVDSSMVWELIKVRVKEFSVKYCCKRSNEQNIVIDLLETKINALDKLIKSDPKMKN